MLKDYKELGRKPITKAEKEVIKLKEENKLLRVQVKANSDVAEFHEELIVEMAMMVYK